MDFKGTRCVVSGGAGFIGSHLVDRLVKQNAREVVIIDDLSTGSVKNIEHHLDGSVVRLEQADICDEARMHALMSGADYVFHLACRNVRLSITQPTIVHDVNATGTLNMLKAAAGAKVRRFLYCSSSEVNGTADVVPMPEDYHFKPETIYGASKLTGEYYTQAFQRSGWLETTIVRPHNNYGPREHYEGINGEVIPRFILMAFAGKAPAIFGDGLQTRDFTYVTETADFLTRIMLAEQCAGNTYNLCRGQEVSILEIGKLISSLTGLNVPPRMLPARPSDVLRLYGDATRLRETLGETPKISIEEGLRMTIEWFRDNVPVTEEVLASMTPENWKDNPSEPWLR